MPTLARLLLSLMICMPILGASAAPQGAPARVTLKTSEGEIVLELYPDRTPKTVVNFLSYVKSGHYNGTIFHRVIDGFMIQGGGFEPGMKQKPVGDPIANEAANGLKNEAYTVAMARTTDPHSATAQFFINTKNNDFLDYPGRDGWGYCAFGKVVKGKDVVDRISGVPVGHQGMHQNVPIKPVIIESASLK